MLQINHLENLQIFLGRGVHLYNQKAMCQGWVIIPVLWHEQHIYTISCFCPKGKHYIRWYQYGSIEEAIFAGNTFVKRQVEKLSLNQAKI